MIDLPDQCPALTNWTFDPLETPEMEIPVTIALGYMSEEAKASYYSEMASRMAGSFGTRMPTSTSAPKSAPTSGMSHSLNRSLAVVLISITSFVIALR